MKVGSGWCLALDQEHMKHLCDAHIWFGLEHVSGQDSLFESN